MLQQKKLSHTNSKPSIHNACEWLSLPKFLCENMPLSIPNPRFCYSQISLLLLSYNPVKLEQMSSLNKVSMNHQVKPFCLYFGKIVSKRTVGRALLTHMQTPKRDFNYQLLQMYPQTSQDWDLSILELHPKDQFQRRNLL